VIKTRLKYCVFDPDPAGNPRYYVRVPGRKKVRIRARFEDPHGVITDDFMAAYRQAIATADVAPGRKATPAAAKESTFGWLLDQYFNSDMFRRFDPLTQADKRSVLTRYGAAIEQLPYAALRNRDIEASRDKRAATPGAADKLVKYLRSLFKWAIRQNLAKGNPADGVEKINEGDGWQAWTLEEVDQYRRRHVIGTKARLALELMLAIGARRSDACRIGRQHEIDGGQWLSFVAHKGRGRAKTRKTIVVPIKLQLRQTLQATALGDTTYLVNDLGKAFTIAGFGNKMRDWCDQADLPHCSAHGLRKASAVAFAEGGASAPELCAVFGWSKLETAEIYIRAARSRVMAENAFTRLDEHRARKSVSSEKAERVAETNQEKKT
jgi:integrase